MSGKVTFRIRRVPAGVSLDSLAGFLHRSIEGLGDLSNIHVRSLAAAPDDWREPPDQVATVDFDKVPSLFSVPGQDEWFVKLTNSNVRLVFDTHFLGFTPLSAPVEEEYAIDCIAISGLASHPFGSWRRRDKTDPYQFMWLRDQLASDFPSVKVLSYGYNTTLQNSESSQSIDDLARAFIGLLSTIGLAEYSAKPLIFLAHSLGGLVLKTALRYLARGDEAEQQILGNLRLIVFFGVPHRGMHIRHLQTIVNGRPNQSLVSMLSTNSDFLPLLEDVFSGILTHRHIRLISAYETVRSRVAELQPSGKLERTGAAEFLVSRESAIHPYSNVPSDVLSIDRDHSEIVKFGPDDYAYLTLRKMLLSTFPQRFEAAGRHSRLNEQKEDILPQHVRYRYGVPQDEALHTFDSIPSEDTRGDISPVLDSLAYEEEDYRLRSIEPAHHATFAWIFENHRLGFVEWMLNGEGIYWIRGKPGSGKSTLFRYLHDNDQFQEMLSSRTLDIRHVDVWYFFNERGTYLQKSLEGLLRGLLRRIASSDEVFAKIITDFYYAKPRELRGRWTMNDIRSVFAAILAQEVATIELTIFLDALDEYFGFPETIVRWIQDCLARAQASHSRTSLRFCISSREYDAFVREFAGAPGFALHLQTKGDIEEYLHGRLSDLLSLNEGIAWTSQISPATVVSILTDRARGVFLWVKLALDELDTLSTNAAAADLRSLIDRLPASLEEFYKRTISRIPSHARSRAYAFLELVHRSPKLLTLEEILEAEACASGATFEACKGLLFHYLHDLAEVKSERPQSSKSQRSKTLLSSQYFARDFKGRQRSAEKSRHLLDLCGGLLEWIETGSSDSDSNVGSDTASKGDHYVQFIHRTVRDFVGKSEFPALILGARHLLQTENGYSFLLKYHCTSNSIQHNPDPSLMALAQAHEKTTGRANAEFLDSLPSSILEQPDPDDIYASAGYTSRFIMGTVAGLHLYLRPYLHPDRVQETRINNPQVINVLAWNISCRAGYIFSYIPRVPNKHGFSTSDIAKSLIRYGFSGTGDFFGLSPFETIFCLSFRGFNGTGGSNHTSEMVQFAETLIQHAGQDPNVPLRSRGWRHVKGVGRRWKSGVRRLWSAVHVSHSNMMAMLLRNGANPNVQDSKGNTALDICIGTEKNVFEIGDHRDPEEAYSTTMMLLSHGAKLTRRGAVLRPVFLRLMRKRFRPCDLSMLENVEVLDLSVDMSDVGDYDYFLSDRRYSCSSSGEDDATSRSTSGGHTAH